VPTFEWALRARAVISLRAWEPASARGIREHPEPNAYIAIVGRCDARVAADVGIARAHVLRALLALRRSHPVVRVQAAAELGDEVFVTYEATRTDGSRFRNTEMLTFDGARLARVEVYFSAGTSSRSPHARR
jgi:hypothetical protein